MQPSSLVREVFGHFQNLSLIALLEDFRHGQIVKGDWSSNQSLCPVAHGMEDGEAVKQLRAATQAINLEAACRFAARRLLAYPHSVYDFVRWWDSLGDTRWLLSELEQLWAERLADADTVQEIIEPIARPVAMPETIAMYCPEQDVEMQCRVQSILAIPVRQSR